MNLLLLALSAMFVQQTFATMGRMVVPIVAPAVIDELGVNPALVGVFVGLAAGAGMVTTLGCGGLIGRYGALRISQIGILLVAAGLMAGAPGSLLLLALAALAIGLGGAVSTPASSHILARYAPPQYAPLVFSLKQTAVPASLILSGIVAPYLAVHYGWRSALLALGAGCVVLALLLQPMRKEFDRERDPSYPLSVAEFKRTFLVVITSPALRASALAGFSFAGIQAVYNAYIVVFLVDGLGYGLTVAGLVYSISTFVSIPARIFWGWTSGRLAPARVILAVLGVAIAGTSVLVGLCGPGWSTWAVIVVATLFSATAISWHGVQLAEVARLAPRGQVGAVTGGVLSFAAAGQMLLPIAYGAILGASGSYGLGFHLLGLPSLAVGLVLFLAPPRAAARPAPGDGGTPRR